jgi:hypothetical protein
MICEQCGGALLHLGTLGSREHWRCRDCGWEQCQLAYQTPADDAAFVADHVVVVDVFADAVDTEAVDQLTDAQADQVLSILRKLDA